MAGLTRGFKNKVKGTQSWQCKCSGCTETIKRGEYVHHKNGNPQDNSPNNLEIYCKKHHRELIWWVLEPGDIAAEKNSGLMQRVMNFIIAPTTDRFHHFLIWRRLDDGDWIILESIPSHGISLGRLSWYDGRDVKFYRRTKCGSAIRSKAPEALVDYGRCAYDFLLPLKLARQLPGILWKMIIKEHKIRRTLATDFHYDTNKAFLCTEAVQRAYLAVGYPIVPKDVFPAPPSFKQAENDGTIEPIHW